MSVNGLIVASEAARICGDPGFTRISREDWLVGLNAVSRDIAVRTLCVEYEATAATVANEDRMIYPANLVQIRYVRYSRSPLTVDHRDLDEAKLDEWRAATNGQYPIDDPTEYLPRLGWLHLLPKPDIAVDGAVLMGYFGLPDDVTNLTTQNIALPDKVRDYLVEGMVIFGKKQQKEYEAAAALEAVWRERLAEWRDRAADPARDRRTSLRASRRSFGRSN